MNPDLPGDQSLPPGVTDRDIEDRGRRRLRCRICRDTLEPEEEELCQHCINLEKD